MSIREQRINEIAKEAIHWRHELHRKPQTMYEEEFASDFVCNKLSEWGIQFERGIAKTGVVATLHGQQTTASRIIAFRADMDALDITEESKLPWASEIEGKMHACGHDGHTTTLLMLARYLQESKTFNGTIRLIFQPAEEGGRGALRMLDEGILDRLPFDEIYGYHNWPGMSRGTFGTRVGPMLAATDFFEINLVGKAGHAAMPHTTRDVVPAAAHLTMAMQTLVSRETNPMDSAVVSVTSLIAGTGADNIIAGKARLGGTVRTFDQELRHRLEKRLHAMVTSTALLFDINAELNYSGITDPVVNDKECTEHCNSAIVAIAGEQSLKTFQPIMGGEDFGGFLQVRPGAFVAIGQAESDASSPHNANLHSPQYDFNDAILPIATNFFAELAERRLPLMR